MSCLLFLMDASPNPLGGGTGALILLLAVVFVLAVSFTVGLVLLLIWLKRRKGISH